MKQDDPYWLVQVIALLMRCHKRLMFCALLLCVVFSLYAWMQNGEKREVTAKSVKRKSREKLVPKTGDKAREKQRDSVYDHVNGVKVPSLVSAKQQLKMDDFIRRHPVPGFQLSSDNGLVEYLDTASCKPIPASLVLYNRIFKTGSETMGSHFKLAAEMSDYVYSKQTTEDFYDVGISDPYPTIIEKEANTSNQQMLFNAHFYFRNNLRLRRIHTYINQVREPVERYLSHYSYLRNTRHRPPERVQKMIESGEWNETIEQCFEKEGQGCKHNLMTRFFCGPERFCKKDPLKAFGRAKENIVKYYAVVGLLEHFKLTLKIIQKRLPCFLPVIPRDPSFRENQAKTNASSVSKEMIAKIKQANWADIELYEFVKQLFWRQVKACGIPETEW